MIHNFDQIDIIRDPYRALLSSGRTYAAFEKGTTIPLIHELRHHGTIIDPMAGFGSLMQFCSEIDVSSFNIEYNPPTFLWGIISNPKYSTEITGIIDALIANKRKMPKIRKRADVSEAWFTTPSQEIIVKLFRKILKISTEHITKEMQEQISLAILIPFVGRLACFVQGNIVTHVKRGGICIYDGLTEDFDRYLVVLKKSVTNIQEKCVNDNHEFVFGDLRTIKLDRKFSAFVTSPPYPNSRDYYKMFAPENDCLLFLKSEGLINGLTVDEPLISCVSVSKYPNKNIIYRDDISSSSAQNFIEYLINYEGKKKQAKYDNRVYYIPYFTSYFYQIEMAYRNFANYLEDTFEGYIIVVNNTARNRVIPVAESIVELFQAIGYNAAINKKYSRELSHVGSINPKVKGFKAKHMEHSIKVWRK